MDDSKTCSPPRYPADVSNHGGRRSAGLSGPCPLCYGGDRCTNGTSDGINVRLRRPEVFNSPPGFRSCATHASSSTTYSCALALATVSPMSPRTLELTHIFRLNENLVAAASRFSNGIAVACTLAVLIAAQRASSLASAAELSYGLCLVIVGVWALVSYWTESAQKSRNGESDFYKRTVKMVYKGSDQKNDRPAEKDGSDGGISGTATAAWKNPATPTSEIASMAPLASFASSMSSLSPASTVAARHPARRQGHRLRHKENFHARRCHPFNRQIARAW